MDAELRDKVTRLDEQIGAMIRFQKWLLGITGTMAIVGVGAVLQVGQYKERIDTMHATQRKLVDQIDEMDSTMAKLQLEVAASVQPMHWRSAPASKLQLSD